MRNLDKNKPKIVLVDYGLASSYGDIIEINRKLKGSLKRKILRHELSHTKGSYSKKDYEIDFKSKDPYFFESLKFSIKNPEALINFFPLMYSYYFKCFTWNSSILFPFLLYGIFFTLASKILFGIPNILAFLGWTCIIIVINMGLLLYTHIYRKIVRFRKTRVFK